jgi:hypothetical protein
MFPALGGRGTEREVIAPDRATRELFTPERELLNDPRFADPAFSGRATAAEREPEPNDPRFGEFIRLTTGRENAREAGAATLAPLEADILARVELTPSE